MSRLESSLGVGRGYDVVGRKSPLSGRQPLLPADEKVMGQNDQGHIQYVVIFDE